MSERECERERAERAEYEATTIDSLRVAKCLCVHKVARLKEARENRFTIAILLSHASTVDKDEYRHSLVNSLARFIGQLSVNMYNILSHVYVYLTIAIGVCWFVEYLVQLILFLF